MGRLYPLAGAIVLIFLIQITVIFFYLIKNLFSKGKKQQQQIMRSCVISPNMANWKVMWWFRIRKSADKNVQKIEILDFQKFIPKWMVIIFRIRRCSEKIFLVIFVVIVFANLDQYCEKQISDFQFGHENKHQSEALNSILICKSNLTHIFKNSEENRQTKLHKFKLRVCLHTLWISKYRIQFVSLPS